MSQHTVPKTVNGLHIILGMGSIGEASNSMVRFSTVEATKELLIAFAKRGYRHLDTARNYPPGSPETCEPIMGDALAQLPEWDFIVDTKCRYAPPNTHSKEKVKASVEGSLKALKLDKMNVEFLHAIDKTSPFPETCQAMDEALKAGQITHFGLSNATPEEVDEFLKACETQALTVRPTVYQGEYNVAARECEEALLDKVREHRMPFYAFSPAGGGLFNSKEYRERAGGRFDEKTDMGQRVRKYWYERTPIMEYAERLGEIASSSGIGGHAVALRWIIWHSKLDRKYGDGIIIGISSIDQMNANLDAIESGPLPDQMVKDIDDAWSAYLHKLKSAAAANL